ncbi:MAG: hypothetical protein ACOYMN_23560, partial [Roseimicrobium sp.]
CDQRGADVRLVTEWVEGPTTLALLKVRQTLSLREVLPLLSQVASAMDYAVESGATTMDTAPERVLIQVSGWGAMSPNERAAKLRLPLGQWPAWSAKVCPLRLSPMVSDLVLPTDPAASEAAGRLVWDFVRLCYQLLTGQGKGDEGYVPASALSPEGNAFFERHLAQDALPGRLCAQLLAELCVAEGVPVPPELAAAGGSEVAARAGAAAASAAAASLPPSAAAEDARKKTEQILQAERERLAQEQAELDRLRRQTEAQEAERARRLSEEQARVEEQRRALEAQQQQLEEKRLEQQRLEQELQLRAQLEFQKHQEEARAHDALAQHQRAAAEDALRQREAEFRTREQKSIEQLEALRRETSVMAEQIHAETVTFKRHQWAHERRKQDEEAVGGLAREELAAGERRLCELSLDLNARQAQWQRSRRRRRLLLWLGILGVLVLATMGAYVAKIYYQDRLLPGQAEWAAAQPAREKARQEHRWAELLRWCIATEAMLRQTPEFDTVWRKLRPQLADDAAEAVRGLLAYGTLPDVGTPQAQELLRDVDALSSWPGLPERVLLAAKLRLPVASARGEVKEFFQLYLDAVGVNPDFANGLAPMFAQGLTKFRAKLRAGQLAMDASITQLLQELSKLTIVSQPAIAQFRAELQAEDARRSGVPGAALRLLLDSARL